MSSCSSLENLKVDVATIGVLKTMEKHGIDHNEWYGKITKQWPELRAQTNRGKGAARCVFVDEDGIQCWKRPYYGYDKRDYCIEHKDDDMKCIQMVSKCPCGKVACFGLPGNKQLVACSKCKTQEMINKRDRHCECGKRPTYGLPDAPMPTHCVGCKIDGMLSFAPKCRCGKQASFGIDGKKEFCAACKPESAQAIGGRCIANKPPHNIPCPVAGNRKYRGFCTRCFANLFPADPLTAQIHTKTKELTVVSHISQHYEGFVHDKPLYFGCCTSYRRIDLRKLIDGTLLSIEVDERQHRGYPPEDEEIRYNQLFADFGGKFVFIRFNPDQYIDAEGKTRRPTMATRLKALCAEIDRQIIRITKGENTELLEQVKLFYDGS